MLADRVWRRADLREQPRRRDGLDQIAFLARQHLRQYRARRIDMAHHIDVPAALPVLVGRLRPPRGADTCVGTEDVNLAYRVGDGIDQVLDVFLIRHVAMGESAGRASDLFRDFQTGFAGDVGDYHGPRPGRRERTTE